jgi:phosphopentomutase
MGVGKIEDIFNHRGLTMSNHTGNNMAGVDGILEYLGTNYRGLLFANLVDFDAIFGHRNNPSGYAEALETFDRRLPEIVNKMKDDDVLIITADHGNDPTTPGTDHSRERVPILICGNQIHANTSISTRNTFADVAASIADFLALDWQGPGSSFVTEVLV